MPVLKNQEEEFILGLYSATSQTIFGSVNLLFLP